MVHEVVLATVDPAKRDEYIEVWKRAWKEANFEGSHGGKILRCVEDPAKIAMILNWDSVEAHQQHRGTEKHNHFREQFGGYQAQPSVIQHYTIEDLPG
ncbi:MAG TPA: antibiotic biosynthesis monooxygenase family protein [Chloroflexota bacterium]|nr:antibiotic biosynthesis monooxygenase family protein [Chloroflexota bacterium]